MESVSLVKTKRDNGLQLSVCSSKPEEDFKTTLACRIPLVGFSTCAMSLSQPLRESFYF